MIVRHSSRLTRIVTSHTARTDEHNMRCPEEGGCMSTIDWLLEPESPGVRDLALRDLLDTSPDDPDLVNACEAAH
jgi:hypothetical protein